MAIRIKSGDLLTVEQLSNHFKVIAGPGAGKTHFLVENIKSIIRTDSKIKNSKHRKILCITYTNTAVDEIKSRLSEYQDSVEVYTIHGFIIKHIIKHFQSELKKLIKQEFDISVPNNVKITSQFEGLNILDDHDTSDIHQFIKQKSDEVDAITYSKKDMGEVEIDVNTFNENEKLTLKGPNRTTVKNAHKLLIKEYCWSKANRLTHDEILYFGYQIIKRNSTVAYILRVLFPYIFIDEFQDTNPLQTKTIKHLGSYSTIVGTIGDIAQSIYSFQGANPKEFERFSIKNDSVTSTKKYLIDGNRRSSTNIVELCNYIRQKDKDLIQHSIKEYKTLEDRKEIEDIKVSFIAGKTDEQYKKINNIVNDGGVVLTRSWVGAFNYIYEATDIQKKMLRQLYYSYFHTPIDIRTEISEHKNVEWVKAFTFIHKLWEGHRTKDIMIVFNAFSMYINERKLKENMNVTLINSLNSLMTKTFINIRGTNKTESIINKFNSLLQEEKYFEVRKLFTHSNNDLIPIYGKYDDNRKEYISALEWRVSFKLFKGVFSPEAKFMTVHQAKGREWKQVIVNLEPTKYDKTNFTKMFNEPDVLSLGDANEFTRLFYVACSRAKEKLYIHIKNQNKINRIKQKLDEYCHYHGISKFYTFE